MCELRAVPMQGKRRATNQWRNIQPVEKYSEQTSENLPEVRTGGGRREEGARARRHRVFPRRDGMRRVGILWVRPFPPDLPGPPMIHSTTGGFRANCIGAASPRARSQEGVISPNAADPQNARGDTPGEAHPSPTGVHQPQASPRSSAPGSPQPCPSRSAEAPARGPSLAVGRADPGLAPPTPAQGQTRGPPASRNAAQPPRAAGRGGLGLQNHGAAEVTTATRRDGCSGRRDG